MLRASRNLATKWGAARVPQTSTMSPTADTADTEWNDVLRSKGILPPKPAEATVTEDDIIAMLDQSATKYSDASAHGKVLEHCTVEELEELEDLEDDRVLEFYRKKRLEEMSSLAQALRFGEVQHITKQEYTTAVSEASKEHPVVVHLAKESLPLCKLMVAHLSSLARKYRATKFVQIVSDMCIPNFPDRNVPTLLIYVNGSMRRQMTAPDFEALGGMDMKVGTLEKELEKLRAVQDIFRVRGLAAEKKEREDRNADREAEDDDDDDDNGRDRNGRSRYTIRTASKATRQNLGDDSDDDWN